MVMSGQVLESCTTGLRSCSAVSRRSAALSRSALVITGGYSCWLLPVSTCQPVSRKRRNGGIPYDQNRLAVAAGFQKHAGATSNRWCRAARVEDGWSSPRGRPAMHDNSVWPRSARAEKLCTGARARRDHGRRPTQARHPLLGRTKFPGLLIPSPRFAHVGVNAAHAQAREHDGIIGGAQCKRGSRTTCFSGLLENK